MIVLIHQLILGVAAAFVAGVLLGIWVAGWLYEAEDEDG